MAMKNPAHPGEILKDELDALDLSTEKAANALGVARSTLHRVLTGKSAITAEMAMRLETVIGGSADLWVRMQAAYDLAQVRQNTSLTKGLRRLTPVG